MIRRSLFSLPCLYARRLCALMCCLTVFTAGLPLLPFPEAPLFPGRNRPLSAVADSEPSESSDILSILLIGQDAREEGEAARSDCMILCSFHRKTKQVTMTSFLRDLYVQIPGHGGNRINAAYALGGSTLLRQTLTENFHIPIDGCIEVDFSQFSQIIDLLGGVPITLRADEARIISRETGTALSEGEQTLNGEQALAYARIRKLDADGDLSRTNRQRKVIRSLLDTCKNTSVTKFLPTLRKLLPLIQTDMRSGQLLLCALEVLPYLSEAGIVSQSVPAEGTYRDETIDGMAVLVTDMEKAAHALQESLSGG